MRLSRKGHTMRKRLQRLRPRLLTRASVAATVARMVLSTDRVPTTPQGVASFDQYLAHARHALDVHGVELDSSSELASALAAFAAVVAIADDPSPEETQIATYAVLRALSVAFVESIGEEVPR